MKELRNCPDCGYRNGFHISFIGKGRDVTVGLICPSCGQHFDLDWVKNAMKDLVSLEEEK